MGDRPPLFCGREPLLDLLTHVKVVLDILERGVVGQVLEELAYFVLGCFQLDLPNCTLPCLKATGQSVCSLGSARAGQLAVSIRRVTRLLSGAPQAPPLQPRVSRVGYVLVHRISPIDDAIACGTT